MNKRQWIQPSLDGGALQRFKIEARFRWPDGWQATCEIVQEPLRFGWTEVSRLTDGTSDDLQSWMEIVAFFCARVGD